MCRIVDAVYRFCNCKLGRMAYCVDFSASAVTPDVPHPIILSSETEHLNLLCTTCDRIAYLRRMYQFGQVRLEEIQPQIGALESGMLKAS